MLKKTKSKVQKTTKAKPKKSSSQPKKVKSEKVKFSAKDYKKWICKVSQALEKENLQPVLVGEACSAIYSSNKLSPKTIEFVVARTTIPRLKRVLAGVGYKPLDLRVFKNNSCPYLVLIAPPPLAVGDELVSDVKIISDGGCKFNALNPTDCIRHRLAHYYRWGDDNVLMQAVFVAKNSKKIDYELIRRWSEWEWADDGYQEFLKHVGEKNGIANK